MATKKQYTVNDLKDTIALYFDTIKQSDCPTVYANIQEPEDKAKMVDNICKIVLTEKIGVGEAIVEWERTYNINSIDNNND